MLQPVIKWTDGLVTALGLLSLGLLTCVAFLQVVARYGFSHALPWPEELCRFLFIALAYVGIALTMRDNRHLCVDLLLVCSPPRLQRALRLLSTGCTTLFMLFLGCLAYRMIWDVKELNYMAASMPIPIYLTWIPIPLCIWITAFYGLLNFASLWNHEDGR